MACISCKSLLCYAILCDLVFAFSLDLIKNLLKICFCSFLRFNFWWHRFQVPMKQRFFQLNQIYNIIESNYFSRNYRTKSTYFDFCTISSLIFFISDKLAFDATTFSDGLDSTLELSISKDSEFFV